MAHEHSAMLNLNMNNSNNSNCQYLHQAAAVAAAAAASKLIKYETADYSSVGGKLKLQNSQVPAAATAVNATTMTNSSNNKTGSAKMGSRRIFTAQFKLQVLESYRNDSDCKGNQRATARKYDIHRRQIQKWLQCESNLRSTVANLNQNNVKHQFHNISSHLPASHSTKASLDAARHSAALTMSSSSSLSSISPSAAAAAIHTPTPTYKHTTTHTPASIAASVPVVPVPHYLHHQHHHHLLQLQLHHQRSQHHHHQQLNQHHHFMPTASPTSASSSSTTSLPNVESAAPTGNDESMAMTTANSRGFHHYVGVVAATAAAPIDLSLGPKRPLEDIKYEIKPLKLANVKIENNNFTEVENKNVVVAADVEDVVDLTTTTCRKRRTQTGALDDESTPEKLVKVEEEEEVKPVKLFKPYLLDDNVEEAVVAAEQQDPIIWSHHPDSYDGRQCSSRGSTTFQSSSNDGYPFPAGSPHFQPTAFSCPKGSPVSGYESSSSTYSESTYSVDIKVQPIDNGYYYDALRMNNLHRNHVQRWLDQETDIRQGIALYV